MRAVYTCESSTSKISAASSDAERFQAVAVCMIAVDGLSAPAKDEMLEVVLERCFGNKITSEKKALKDKYMMRAWLQVAPLATMKDISKVGVVARETVFGADSIGDRFCSTQL